MAEDMRSKGVKVKSGIRGEKENYGEECEWKDYYKNRSNRKRTREPEGE